MNKNHFNRQTSNKNQNQSNKNEDVVFPIRINRYLFLKGYCSRRQADRFIENGLVKINGQKASLGQKVEENDSVTVDQKVEKVKKEYEYYVFHKPIGIVSHNPQRGEKSIEDVFTVKTKAGIPLAVVGRLDKDSEGLVFLTNDGRIVDKMLNPKFDHQKEYMVQVDKEIKESFINKMSKGVLIEGYKTRPAIVDPLSDTKFSIILTEGKKHQIRRMCAALGYQVKKLKRVRIMNLNLGRLPRGKGRKLRLSEKLELFKKIGLN